MNELDKKISEMIGVVQEKKKEIEKLKDSLPKGWKTNCSYKFSDGQSTNIATKKKEGLIEVVKDLVSQTHLTELALDVLGLEKKEIKVNGYTKEEWLEDIKKRLSMVDIAEKTDELENLEKRLDAIVSPEQRRALELELIMKKLSG